MGALFIFILISVLVVSALLFFNKGEKALEIKSILKDIAEDFKILFTDLKKLFLIVKELIQSKLDQEPTQIKDTSTESQAELSAESEINSPQELESPTENSLIESIFCCQKICGEKCVEKKCVIFF